MIGISRTASIAADQQFVPLSKASHHEPKDLQKRFLYPLENSIAGEQLVKQGYFLYSDCLFHTPS